MELYKTQEGVYFEPHGTVFRSTMLILGMALFATAIYSIYYLIKNTSGSGPQLSDLLAIKLGGIILSLIAFGIYLVTYWHSMLPVIIRKDGWVVKLIFGRHHAEWIGPLSSISHRISKGPKGVPIHEAYVHGQSKAKKLGPASQSDAETMAQYLEIEFKGDF